MASWLASWLSGWLTGLLAGWLAIPALSIVCKPGFFEFSAVRLHAWSTGAAVNLHDCFV
jgi:hypothetical protein